MENKLWDVVKEVDGIEPREDFPLYLRRYFAQIGVKLGEALLGERSIEELNKLDLVLDWFMKSGDITLDRLLEAMELSKKVKVYDDLEDVVKDRHPEVFKAVEILEQLNVDVSMIMNIDEVGNRILDSEAIVDDTINEKLYVLWKE